MGRNRVYLRVSGIFGRFPTLRERFANGIASLARTSLSYSEGFSASFGARKCLSPVIDENLKTI
jgi:hypothetical protein